MRFDNTFEVAGTPAQVIALFENLPLMASFLPGASLGERHSDGSYPATLVLSFGPKRLTFKGALTAEVDPVHCCGKVVGHASADLRGAKMSVQMNYQLVEAASGTRVTLLSQAEMTGVLAEFAMAGGTVVTQALLAEFAQRLSTHVRSLQTDVSGTEIATTPQTLSAFSLLLRIIQTAMGALRARLPF